MKTITAISNSTTTENKPPKVSIGLAVFNGEKYLREAIDSILAQTFTDFELIISDNASSDRTAEICQEYAARDSRIRYYRNATNIGGANNENQTFKLSRGKYFRLAAHDDVLAPELIENCVEVLDNNPTVILCYSTIVQIDEYGNQIGILEQNEVMQGSPFERFQYLGSLKHQCEATYGLIRADILSKTELQPNYPDSDRTWLCELSLYGSFYIIPKPLFYKRIHAEMSTNVYSDVYDRILWFKPDISETNISFLVRWYQFLHYFRIISRTPLSLNERLRCYLWLGNWMLQNRQLMIKELLWTMKIIRFNHGKYIRFQR